MLAFLTLGQLSCNNTGFDVYTLTHKSSQGFKASEKYTPVALIYPTDETTLAQSFNSFEFFFLNVAVFKQYSQMNN